MRASPTLLLVVPAALALLSPGAAFAPFPVASLPSRATRPVHAPPPTARSLLPPDAVASAASAAAETSAALDPMGASLCLSSALDITPERAELLAGPFFGASLFPYLAFLYFLNVEENDCPKGVTVGFATCLVFVFLSIPAAIAAKLLYGLSLADSDWLHGSAESVLTITNLVTVVAFRQALSAKEEGTGQPASAERYGPMAILAGALTALAALTVLAPALAGPTAHTPYLGGFMDLPPGTVTWGSPEPENALTVATWIIHISSLVEFLVAMGFAWRWADAVGNPRWKGLTWGLLPLHSSGICACVYHVFYNSIPLLLPLQASLTCVGNVTAAAAAYRIAVSNGWEPPEWASERIGWALPNATATAAGEGGSGSGSGSGAARGQTLPTAGDVRTEERGPVGFEDLGDALSDDADPAFLLKLFAGCAVASYAIKYGEILFDFPYEADARLGLAAIAVPSALNAYKWSRRSKDPTFEGWF